MKKYFTLLFLLTTIIAQSQYQMDLVTRQSSDRSVSQKIGFTEITVKYGSPVVKDRQTWGELVPYDKVWRAGANWATTVEFTEPVHINQQVIKKGIYSLFVIPQKDKKWIMVLNSIARQWGAFKYDATKDVIRKEVIPQAIPKQEKLIYAIDNKDSQLAHIQLKWDTVALTLPIEIDIVSPLDSLLSEKSDQLSNDLKWVAYLQAAELLLQENQDLNTALAWIEKSESISVLDMEWNPQYYPKAYILGHLYWTKARINGALGNQQAALEAVKQMKHLKEPLFYQKEAESEEMEKWINKWQKK